MSRKSVSKYLSWALRHGGPELGLELEPGGWVPLDELLEAARRNGRGLSRDHVLHVVEKGEKRRFELDSRGRRIRARYGHSLPVDLELEPVEPPGELFHGTAERFVESILRDGLRPGQRRHVHLSPDRETAREVGGRHGRPVILVVRARELYRAGQAFYRPTSEVWLTTRVPPDYVESAD